MHLTSQEIITEKSNEHLSKNHVIVRVSRLARCHWFKQIPACNFACTEVGQCSECYCGVWGLIKQPTVICMFNSY